MEHTTQEKQKLSVDDFLKAWKKNKAIISYNKKIFNMIVYGFLNLIGCILLHIILTNIIMKETFVINLFIFIILQILIIFLFKKSKSKNIKINNKKYYHIKLIVYQIMYIFLTVIFFKYGFNFLYFAAMLLYPFLLLYNNEREFLNIELLEQHFIFFMYFKHSYYENNFFYNTDYFYKSSKATLEIVIYLSSLIISFIFFEMLSVSFLKLFVVNQDFMFILIKSILIIGGSFFVNKISLDFFSEKVSKKEVQLIQELDISYLLSLILEISEGLLNVKFNNEIKNDDANKLIEYKFNELVNQLFLEDVIIDFHNINKKDIIMVQNDNSVKISLKREETIDETLKKIADFIDLNIMYLK